MENFWENPLEFPMMREARFPAVDVSENEKVTRHRVAPSSAVSFDK
jgi:hypothetical protein